MSFVRDTVRDLFGGASRDAADIQAQSGNAAIQELRAARGEARSDLAPFRDAGTQALDLLFGPPTATPTYGSAPSPEATRITELERLIQQPLSGGIGGLISGTVQRNQWQTELDALRARTPVGTAAGTSMPRSGGFINSYDDSVERDNILRDVQRSAAAGGRLRSGGTLMELTRQLYGLQQRNRAQRFSELFNLATLGANAAGGQATATMNTGSAVADTTTGIGNAQAAGRIGSSNQTQNTLFSVLRTVMGIGV